MTSERIKPIREMPRYMQCLLARPLTARYKRIASSFAGSRVYALDDAAGAEEVDASADMVSGVEVCVWIWVWPLRCVCYIDASPC